jgi:hypothetical protein
MDPHVTSDTRVLSVVVDDTTKAVTVRFKTSPPAKDDVIVFAAGAPHDRGASFEGSCLPFPSFGVAMHGGSRGVCVVDKDAVEDDDCQPTYVATLSQGMPNSYYGKGWEDSDMVHPSMEIAYTTTTPGGGDVEMVRGRVKIGERTQLKTLTPFVSPFFINEKSV